MARGRNVINQSIALEGGDEIVAMLRKMGTEGEAAARKLEKAFGRVEIRKGIEASFDRMKASFSRLQDAGGKVSKSFGNVTASAGKVGSAFSAMRGKVLLYTAALTGATAGMAAFVNASLNRIDDLGDLAASIGVNKQELQGLMAAGATAGVEGRDFVKTIASLTNGLDELQGSASGGAASVVKIGRSFTQTVENGVTITRGIMGTGDAARQATKEIEKLSPQAAALKKILEKAGVPKGKKLVPMDVYQAAAKVFSSMQDGAEKTGLAIDLLGPKLGPKLIPLLNQGEGAIAKYFAEWEKKGAILSDFEIDSSGKAADSIVTLTGIFTAFVDKLVAQFAPDITNAVDTIFAALSANGDSTKQFITQTGKAIGTLISDITKLSVGDTAHIQNRWIVDLHDWIVKAATAAETFYTNVLVPGFRMATDAAEPLAKLINSVLGTDMSGTDVVILAVITQLIGGFKLFFAVLGLGVNTVGLLINTLRLIPALGGFIIDAFAAIGTGILSVGELLPGLAAMLGPAGLIALAVAGLGILIYAFWDDIVAFTKQAFTFIVDAVSAGWEGVKTVSAAIWDGMKTMYSDTWDGIKTVAADALAAVETVYRESWTGLQTIASDARAGLITVVSDTWTGITSTVAMARDGLYAAASQTWGAIRLAANDLGTSLAPIWEGIRNTAAAAFQSVADLVMQAWSGASATVVQSAEAIQQAIQTATNVAGDVAGASEIAARLVAPFRDAQAQIQQITATFGSIARAGLEGVSSAIAGIAQQINAQIASIISALQRAVAAAQRLRSQASSSSSSSSSSSGGRYATGGYVRGPGSGTSDSIPAWLSNGEFVIRAAAVRRYGLDFLRSINGMAAGISLKGGLRGFAAGGLVDMPRVGVPALALAGAGGIPSSALTLVIGAESFGGLSGPSDTIARLEKAIRARRIRSAGRPSPYAAR